MSMTVSTMEVL